MTYSVYRCIDVATGQVVYIGVTEDLKKRIRQHRHNRNRTAVGRYIAANEVRWELIPGRYQDRAEALDQERWAIYRERPLLNRQHNGLGRYAETAFNTHPSRWAS